MNKQTINTIVGFLIVIIIGVIYLLISAKFNSKTTDNTNKIPTNANVNEVIKSSIIKNYVNVVKVLKVNKTYNITMTLNTESEFRFYTDLEHQAAILMNTFKDINAVIYTTRNIEYLFNKSDMDILFAPSVKATTLKVISDYYSSLPLDKTYLGNINNNYLIFDTSNLCNTEYEVLYETTDFIYKVKCSEVNNLILIDKNQVESKLLDALNNHVIEPEVLLNKGIDVMRVSKIIAE